MGVREVTGEGLWLADYYGKVAISSSLVAELWSIRACIALAKELSYKKLIVESDSKMTIDMLNSKCERPSHVLVLLDDCSAYSKGIDITCQHTYKEGIFAQTF